jgi:hypothetical protein
MNRRNWILTGLLLIAVVVALAGPVSIKQAQAQDAPPRVRFLHAVPGAPSVDIYLDGTLVASNLAFGRSTPHMSIASGDHQIMLRQTGLAMDAAPLIEAGMRLEDLFAYIVVVQGTPDAIATAVYDDPMDPIEPGLARVFAINTVADAPPLDMLRTDEAPLLQGVTYGAQFGSINVPAGPLDLVVVPAGGNIANPVASFGQFTLNSGTLYTLVTLGTLAEGASALVIATPVDGAADTVRVQFAHGSPDAPAVDLYANGTLVASSLELGEMTGHLAFPTGAYTVEVRPAGAPAADAPVISAELTFDAPAQTVAVLGQTTDETLAVQVFPDNVADITPEQARIAVINTVTGSTATVGLTDSSGTVLAANLAGGSQSDITNAAAGEYMLTVSVQGLANPVDLLVPAEKYYGGTYYSVLVYGGGPNNVAYNARVAGTGINVTSDSAPGLPLVAVAAVPTATPEVVPTQETVPLATAEPTTEAAPPPAETPVAVPTQSEVVVPQPTQSELVVAPQPTQSELVVAQPTLLPVATQPPPQPIVPQAQQATAYVELNPGANLQCRELPGSDKRSLGLIPSGTTLTVIGRTGTPLVPETGNATPEPTPEVLAIEELWLSVQWNPPSGGYLRCWVNAQFLRVEFRGKLLDTLEELWALPEEPFNRPGEVAGADIAPPTPLFNAVIATVQLEPGVSLQLRRYPETQAESLSLVPAQAQLEVLGYAEAPSEGLVGQPTNPNWLYVRYRTENGGATIGWVSVEYVVLSQLGRPVELTTLPVVDVAEAGYFELPGQAPIIPLELQDAVGVVNLNPGANLNLRDRPTADARVVVGIPSGDSMVLNGRNGNGTWVQVTYASAGGDLEGWVATQYLTITRGGQPYDIKGLPIVTGETDTMGAVPTATP